MRLKIRYRKARKDGRTSLGKVIGDTPDISEWVYFEFYELALCWNQIEVERTLDR